LFAAVGGRTTAQGYAGGDGVRQQFTQKERDNETGLDYFLARYYSSTMGRFTSADSVAGSLSNPQSLNLYSYTLNNPVNLTDPTGHLAEGPHGGIIDEDRDRFETPYCKCQGRPTTTKPQAPPGFEIRPDGTLVKSGGGAVVEEAVTVTAKRGIFGRLFGKVGRLLGFGGGPVTGAAHIIIGEMINPQPVGGGDADLGPNSYPWLTPEIQSTFLNGEVSPYRLEHDTTFFRYFGPTPMIGPGVGYFSAQQFSTAEEARKMLALSPTVTGNKAQQVVSVTVPGGTIVLIGQAAAQSPRDKYSGSGSQVVVGNPRDPGIRYGTPRRLP
jgi:RHS repeat-associated protein